MDRPQVPVYAAAAVDALAAGAASMAVSPFILTIDKAIVQSAAGHTSLLRACMTGVTDIIRRPQRALLSNPAYWMVAAVYGVTYFAANLIDTACGRMSTGPALQGTMKLFGTTAVNTSACIAKDVAFARMFGAQSTGRMPVTTLALFGARDLLTIGSAFSAPPLLAKALAQGGVEATRAENAAQLISPIGMQVFCAPLHLLALNMYNMPVATLGERAAAVARTAPQTIVAYAVRMAPAFGVGGVMNTALTTHGRDFLRERYADNERSTRIGVAVRLQTAASG